MNFLPSWVIGTGVDSMYYILHILSVYLYVLPTLFTDSYTEPNGLLRIFIHSIIGVVFGIIHFLINYCYGKRRKLNTNRAFATPIFVMALFMISYYINYASNHFPYNHVNHYGFYLFEFLIIIWSFVSFFAINIVSGVIPKHGKLHFKKVGLKHLSLKLFIFIIVLFIICSSTEVVKNEILTFKYGEQFEDLTCIKENVGTYKSFKVVDYSDYEACLYYITDYEPNPIGFIIRLEYYYGRWNYRSDYAVWSTTGSASKTIWPYWWHFIYGGF